MKILITMTLVLGTLFTTHAWAATTEESNESVFSKNQKFDNEGVELYDTNLELKNYKKIGLGVATGGLTGLIGLNLEVNLKPEDAITFGLGTGEAYNSFNIGYKRNFEAAYLSPYVKAGYANWFNGNKSSGSAADSSILKRVLTEKQIKDNKFSANFLAAGAGLEYNQLEGELAGVNFWGELLILGELNSSVYLPTAGVGMTYFY